MAGLIDKARDYRFILRTRWMRRSRKIDSKVATVKRSGLQCRSFAWTLYKSMGPVEEVSANRGIEQDNLNDLALWAADLDLKLQSMNQESFNNRTEHVHQP